MKIKNLYILILAFTMGCTSQSFNSILGNGTNGKASCTSTSALGAKITQLNHDLQENIATTEGQNFIFDERDFETKIVPAGTEIIVAVDRDCVLSNIGSTVLKDVFTQIKNTKSKFMTQQSLSWKLKRDYSVQELKQIALTVPCIVALSPNKKLELHSIPNDENYNFLSHLKALKYPSIYDKVFSKLVSPDNVVVVAVIDTGNDLKHPDMMGQHWENLKEKNGLPGVDDDGNGYVDDDKGWNFTNNTGDPTGTYQTPHGEHVSGLIAALVNNGVGVAGLAAPRVKIMHLNIFKMVIFGVGQPDPLLLLDKAIRYAADNGAQVINLSVGNANTSTTQRAALKYAVDKGVFITTSAGNNQSEISESAPAVPAMYAKDLPGMIAVAANDAVSNSLCSFTNYSTNYVEIAAPGCDTSATDEGLLSTDRYNDKTQSFPYKYMAGTSMASPLVAAAAAAAISYIKEKSGVAPSNVLIKKILKESSRVEPGSTSKVDQGHTLDLVSLFSYIDKQILNIECP